MKKLTLVLVALLLALTCVFVACGKKNETPVDTDPKPVDDNPTPAPADNTPAVTVEDMTPVAEQFKKDLAANYVDLYSKEVENAIDAEKSAALLKIMGATTKEEAQKIADEFIAFLKAQKNSYDILKELVAQIGDVALADEELVKEAKAYKAALDDAYAGTNEAKKAVLDAYKADKDTQKAVKAMDARLDVLKDAKALAAAEKDEKIVDVSAMAKALGAGDDFTKAIVALFDTTPADGKFDTDGVNAQIAALNEAFADKKIEEFKLTDVNDYEKLVKLAADVAAIYEIEVGSDAYNEIFDVTTLAATKAILDAAIDADPVLIAMKNVVAAADALKATAEAARYKEFVKVDKTDLEDAADSTHTLKVEYEGETKYATPKLADDAKAENVVEVEKTATKVTTRDYKLSLYKDIEAAVKVKNALVKKYSDSKLTGYGYKAAGDVVKAAVDVIDGIEAAYNASVTRAEALLAKDICTSIYTDVKLEKKDTNGTFTGFATTQKKYKTDLATEIGTIVDSFKYVNASGYEVSAKTEYTGQGDYTLGGKSFYLKGGVAAIEYRAWTYAWQLEKAGDIAGSKQFDMTAALIGANAGDGEYFINWLVKYIGEGEYGEKIDLNEFKDYGTNAFTDVVIYMTDRDVTEVATATVTKINGAAVTVEKSDALEAKVLSPYTIAQNMVAEAKKIADAKADALDKLAAAALALREVGEANAVEAAVKLYQDIIDGTYLNEKLYDGEIKVEYTSPTVVATTCDQYKLLNQSAAVAALEAVTAVDKKGNKTEKSVSDIITAANTALTSAKALVDVSKLSDAALKTANAALDENKAYIEYFEDFLKVANKKAQIAIDGYATTNSDDTRLTTKTIKDAAELALAQANAVKDLMLSKAAFDAVNEGNTLFTAAVDAAEFCTKLGAFSASGETTYTNLDTSDDDQKAEKDFYDYLVKLLAATVKKSQDKLVEAVATAEKDLTKNFADFKIDLKANAVNAANVATAKTNIETNFADKYNADYLNLTATYTFGEKVITIDYFTEVYRQQVMATAYKAIVNVVNFANAAPYSKNLTGGTYNDPTTWTSDSWAGTAVTNLNDLTFSVGELASIKAAKETVKTYVVDDGVYDFDQAATEIGADVDLVKAAAKAN